jgi:hypothetical protein
LPDSAALKLSLLLNLSQQFARDPDGQAGGQDANPVNGTRDTYRDAALPQQVTT